MEKDSQHTIGLDGIAIRFYFWNYQDRLVCWADIILAPVIYLDPG